MSRSEPLFGPVSVSSRCRLGCRRFAVKSLISLRLGSIVSVPSRSISVAAKSLILQRLGLVSLVHPPKGGKGRGPEPPPLSPFRLDLNANRQELLCEANI